LTVEGDKAYGRGSVDDKGNVASLMFALKELKEKPLNGKVLFAFTGDEELEEPPLCTLQRNSMRLINCLLS